MTPMKTMDQNPERPMILHAVDNKNEALWLANFWDPYFIVKCRFRGGLPSFQIYHHMRGQEVRSDEVIYNTMQEFDYYVTVDIGGHPSTTKSFEYVVDSRRPEYFPGCMLMESVRFPGKLYGLYATEDLGDYYGQLHYSPEHDLVSFNSIDIHCPSDEFRGLARRAVLNVFKEKISESNFSHKI